MSKKEEMKKIFIGAGFNPVIVEAITNENFLLEEKAEFFLRAIGMPQDLLGFKFIIEALKCYDEEAENGEKIKICKQIYPNIAKKYSKTPLRVERDIRQAITITFNNMPQKMLDILFPNIQLTNGRFLSNVYNWLKMC